MAYGKFELKFEISFQLRKFCGDGLIRKIKTKDMVEKSLTHPEILSNYSTICCDVSDVEKELELSLLVHMLILYLRVRSFPYPKDKVQQYKVLKKKSKSRSLRTEIKRSSTDSDFLIVYRKQLFS